MGRASGIPTCALRLGTTTFKAGVAPGGLVRPWAYSVREFRFESCTKALLWPNFAFVLSSFARINEFVLRT